jgi:DNA polymerase III sliding clamp (beta) subunit (PCNA family)
MNKTTIVMRDFKDFDAILKACDDSQLVEDLSIKPTRDGLVINEIDRSIVLCADISIKSSYFDEYETGVENKTITLNLPELRKNIKSLDKKSKVIINIADTEAHFIQHTSFTTDTTQKLLTDVRKDEYPTIEAMKWATDFTIKSDTFKKIVKNFTDKDLDFMVIETKDDGIHFSSGATELVVYKGDESLLDTKSDHAKSRYSVEYLEKIAKFANPKMFDSVKISLSTDFPIKVEMTNDNFKIGLILAPRIAEE